MDGLGDEDGCRVCLKGGLVRWCRRELASEIQHSHLQLLLQLTHAMLFGNEGWSPKLVGIRSGYFTTCTARNLTTPFLPKVRFSP